uniref:AlNc14C104G6142 protein n=1 Tax=Albugo laibachii Nc14 TaxID=890382 RepID=F0WHT5_9STRA|nr:AlNc14C104G6142 [Albugo laibachii Nc14]|eukprot:CCA20810.1 AlNc14C104G6142 [Albugo laibachii Nc14]
MYSLENRIFRQRQNEKTCSLDTIEAHIRNEMNKLVERAVLLHLIARGFKANTVAAVRLPTYFKSLKLK